MDNQAAILAFKALAQDSRLAIYKALVVEEPHGLPASEISRRLGILPSTLSGHLALLNSAGLVKSRRDGREIIYTAQLKRMGALVDFLLVDCCNGQETDCTAIFARDRL